MEIRFVEFDTAADLKSAVEKLDNREFKGARVNCVADVGRPRRDSADVSLHC